RGGLVQVAGHAPADHQGALVRQIVHRLSPSLSAALGRSLALLMPLSLSPPPQPATRPKSTAAIERQLKKRLMRGPDANAKRAGHACMAGSRDVTESRRTLLVSLLGFCRGLRSPGGLRFAAAGHGHGANQECQKQEGREQFLHN